MVEVDSLPAGLCYPAKPRACARLYLALRNRKDQAKAISMEMVANLFPTTSRTRVYHWLQELRDLGYVTQEKGPVSCTWVIRVRDGA